MPFIQPNSVDNEIVEREWHKERAEGKAKKDKVDAGTAALVIVGRLDQDESVFLATSPGPDRFTSTLSPKCQLGSRSHLHHHLRKKVNPN
jgi:hypothetical protein